MVSQIAAMKDNIKDRVKQGIVKQRIANLYHTWDKDKWYFKTADLLKEV